MDQQHSWSSWDIRGNNLEGRLDGSAAADSSGSGGRPLAAAAAAPAAGSTGRRLLGSGSAAAAAAAANNRLEGLEVMGVRVGRGVLQDQVAPASPASSPEFAAAAAAPTAAAGQPWTGLEILGYVDLSGNQFSGQAASQIELLCYAQYSSRVSSSVSGPHISIS